MLLTISTTRRPATDLGFLLHKHPDKFQSFDTGSGTAHVFYPEASEDRCTAALHLELDPIVLARGKEGARKGQALVGHYVNDRPHVASSFLTVAISRALGTAMNGVCKTRPELPGEALPLEIRIVPLPARGGADMIRRLFEPLGWTVAAACTPMDPRFPEWGDAACFDVTLTGTLRLADALAQLTVLIPVLDGAKHYHIDEAEAEKLMKRAEGWLPGHPDRGLIVHRYLRRRRGLASDVLERLAAIDPALAETVEAEGDEESPVPTPANGAESLNSQRLKAVTAALKASGATSVVDLGCGQGNLLEHLIKDGQFARIAGTDVSVHALEIAARRLRLDRMAPSARERIALFQGALTYRDGRLKGFDAAALVEVIEHVDPERLPAIEAVVFGHARPKTVVVSTPNREFNALYGMEEGALRHSDHRFEWTRAEFAAWCASVAERFGYRFTISGIGAEDPVFGCSTQMAVFTLEERAP